MLPTITFKRVSSNFDLYRIVGITQPTADVGINYVLEDLYFSPGIDSLNHDNYGRCYGLSEIRSLRKNNSSVKIVVKGK